MQRALRAARPRRFADLAPVLDEIDVEAIGIFRGNHAFKDVVGLLRRGSGTDEAQPFGDPVHVSVHRDTGESQGKEQDAAGRLGPHAVERGKPVQGI